MILRHRSLLLRAGGVAALAVGAVTACRPSADLLSTPKPVGSQLELRRTAARGDTTLLAVHFSTAPSTSVGSLTAAITLPVGWRFIACTPAQGEPLLACKAADGLVRIAGAWVAGTHSGDLLTVQVVREVAAAEPLFTLDVQEMHDGIGRSLADSVGVRREVTP